MARLAEVYLDIETTWSGEPTVVGFRSSVTGVVQLIGSEITKKRLANVLPKSGALYTFNGHCFDLPRIHQHVGLNLHDRFTSRDLRFICGAAGMKGGQKTIETMIGFSRSLPGLDGRAAIQLWNRFVAAGDKTALEILQRYNAEDLEGLIAIKRHLARHNREALLS